MNSAPAGPRLARSTTAHWECVTGTRNIINLAFQKSFYPDSDPIGRHIADQYPTTRETFEIIGVVPGSKEHRPSETKQPRFYANLAHPIGAVESVTFLLRSVRDPGTVASAVRRVIGQIDATLPILSLRAAPEQIDRRIRERLVAWPRSSAPWRFA